MKNLAIATAAAFVLMGPAARAATFTFDFQNPDGQGSSFGDAISLNTDGAVTDDIGDPIGFTKLNGSTGDTTLALTSGGLEFDVPASGARDNFSLGVPFDTTGTAKITARFGINLPQGNMSAGKWGTGFGDSDDGQ